MCAAGVMLYRWRSVVVVWCRSHFMCNLKVSLKKTLELALGLYVSV